MRYLLLILALFCTTLNAFALEVVYPKKDKVSINCKTTFFVGSAAANAPLTINGVKVPVHSSGGFAHFVNLKYGENIFKIESNGETLVYKVHSTLKPSAANNKSSAASVKTKIYAESKLAYTKNELTPIRTTPVAAGINRIVHLQKGVPLYIDGETGKFYRATFSNSEKYWVAKNDVEVFSERKSAKSAIISKTFKDTGKHLVYTFDLSGKTPYIVTENSDNDFENGLGLNFYNTILKPDSPYELYFPIQHELFGYNAQFQEDKFILSIRKFPKISAAKPLKDIVIAVDAGHGGNEKGAIGCLGNLEKDLTLDVALKLQKELEKLGAKVIMTRTEDEKVSLKKRIEITNENDASIFVSVHGNALPDSMNPLEHRGTSVYYYYPQAKKLAEFILKSMNKEAQTKDNGVRQGSFAVVRNTNALSVLVELAYLINPEDNALLMDENFRAKCAKAIANGIANYLKTFVS